MERQIVLSGTIERAEERSRERLFERIIIVHVNAEFSRERSHERLCERTYLPSLSC